MGGIQDSNYVFQGPRYMWNLHHILQVKAVDLKIILPKKYPTIICMIAQERSQTEATLLKDCGLFFETLADDLTGFKTQKFSGKLVNMTYQVLLLIFFIPASTDHFEFFQVTYVQMVVKKSTHVLHALVSLFGFHRLLIWKE